MPQLPFRFAPPASRLARRLPAGRPSHSITACSLFGLLLLVCGTTIAAAAPPTPVIGSVDGQNVEGLQLLSTRYRQVILGNDGWLFDVDPNRTDTRLEVTEARFRPIELMEMRRRLQTEFGPGYEVVATQHFLVVQPAGTPHRWADRFEALHRAFLSYFRVRNITPRRGNFPMVAIVLPDHETFRRHTPHATGNILGVYDRRSNRITMYDHGDSSGGVDATVCHEAAHQSAFNVGIHSRVSETPLWIIEGIGCLFQAPALMAGHHGGNTSGRCDPNLLWSFQNTYGDDHQRLAGDMQSLIRSDNLFRDAATNERAYLASWALTFYLAERREAEFRTLVETYSSRPPFRNFTEDQRISEFQRIVGAPDPRLAKQIMRFLAAI